VIFDVAPEKDSILIKIIPYRVMDGKMIKSLNSADIKVDNVPQRRVRLKKDFPLGGVMIGGAMPLVGDSNAALGFDVEGQAPLWSERLGCYADLRWMGLGPGAANLEALQSVSGSAGLRLALPWRNYMFRLEPFLEAGYFVVNETEQGSPLGLFGDAAEWKHGPELSLGLRSDIRGLGLFARATARVNGLYAGQPSLQVALAAGVDWSFIKRWW
jgi:hypothetical protein